MQRLSDIQRLSGIATSDIEAMDTQICLPSVNSNSGFPMAALRLLPKRDC